MERRSFILQTLICGARLGLPAANQMGSATTRQPWATSASTSPVSASQATPRPHAVNGRSLGAKGDGITDDTAAIQQALASFDRVFLPPGTYRVNNPQLKTGNALFGSGQQSVLLQHPAAPYAGSANIRISNCYASRPANQDEQRMFYRRQGKNETPDAASAPLGRGISNCRSDGLPLSMTLMAVKRGTNAELCF